MNGAASVELGFDSIVGVIA